MTFGGRPVEAVAQYALPDDPLRRASLMLRKMAAHVVEAVTHDEFVRWAVRTTSDGRRSTDPVVRAQKALRHVQRMHYVWDPVGVERLQKPAVTAKIRRGDCNSLAGLVAAMLEACGIPTRLVMTKLQAGGPEWQHVWPEALIAEHWIPVDPCPIGQGRRARYLPLGHVAIEPVEPITIITSEPDGAIRGIFDSVGDFFEGLKDFVVNIATAKYFKKGLRWTWQHMSPEMRMLAARIGEAAAAYYGGPMAKEGAHAAFQLLQQDMVSRKQRKHAKKVLEELKAKGVIPKDADIKDGATLEAIWVAFSTNPQQLKAQPQARQANPKALLPVAALLLLPISWPIAAVTAGVAVIANRNGKAAA